MRHFRILPVPDKGFAEIPLPDVAVGQSSAARRLRSGVSLKEAGDLRGSAARWRAGFFRRLGVEPGRVFACRQVHSTRVVEVREGLPAQYAQMPADGLITDRMEAVLSVTVADCLPILLADRRGRAFGILHSGWRGTGIVLRAIEQMERAFGCRREELAVVMGPGIGSCCYEVQEERYAAFLHRFGSRAVLHEPGAGSSRRFFLDLRQANAILLEQAGVTDVAAAEECTACTPHLSSFRRDGPGFARMVAFIGDLEG